MPVRVSPGGALSDNYDPRKRALFLSEAVYMPPTVAAAAVAAHEAEARAPARRRVRAAADPLGDVPGGRARAYYLLVFFGDSE